MDFGPKIPYTLVRPKMPYRFGEVGEVSCGEIASSHGSALIGCLAVNSSYDSGRITLPRVGAGQRLSISPVTNEHFIEKWPVSHDADCDEWWVFDDSVPSDFFVTAFCNDTGMRIADYKQFDWAEECPLNSYLDWFRPKVVFGNNDFGHVIYRT